MELVSSTLIVTTYNWPAALELCLLSIKEQAVLPNEVVIADDGSTNATKNLINSFQKNFPVKLVHVWQEDIGFRASEIRNKAINASKNEYIIQIDGDMILHKNFVKDHLKAAKKGVFLTGSRVWLSKEASLKAQKNKTIAFNFFTPNISNRLNGLHVPFLTKLLKSPTKNIDKAVSDIRGCNMSFWKSDLIAINGYDEEIFGWGREDSDLSVRLVHLGKTKERLKFGAIQYHQYHALNSRSEFTKNDNIMNMTIESKKIRCVKGLDKSDCL